jgi:hypothetical protein
VRSPSNASRSPLVPAALAGWTVFVWGTRVRNIVRDGGGSLSLLVAVAMVVLAVAVAVSLVRRGSPRWAVPALAAATVAAWAVRAPMILTGDHGAAFKVVHTVLALVSVALAVAAVRATASPPSAVLADREAARSGRGR